MSGAGFFIAKVSKHRKQNYFGALLQIKFFSSITLTQVHGCKYSNDYCKVREVKQNQIKDVRERETERKMERESELQEIKEEKKSDNQKKFELMGY
jgi:hypothetical protein